RTSGILVLVLVVRDHPSDKHPVVFAIRSYWPAPSSDSVRCGRHRRRPRQLVRVPFEDRGPLTDEYPGRRLFTGTADMAGALSLGIGQQTQPLSASAQTDLLAIDPVKDTTRDDMLFGV